MCKKPSAAQFRPITSYFIFMTVPFSWYWYIDAVLEREEKMTASFMAGMGTRPPEKSNTREHSVQNFGFCFWSYRYISSVFHERDLCCALTVDL
jgi:hypothetical protein